jgi:GntR family transcriptional regulator
MPIVREVKNPVLEPIGVIPMEAQAAARLRSAIESGAFGKQLPSENELCRQLRVSRSTVRAAVQTLVEQGLLTKQRGTRTRVNMRVSQLKLPLNAGIGFWDLISQAGHQPSTENEVVLEREASTDIAEKLECEPGTKLKVISRLFCADGAPAIYLEDIFLSSLIKDVAKLGSLPKSIYDFAEVNLIRPIGYTIAELIPMASNAFTVEKLSLPIGTPLLHLVERHFQTNEHPVVVSFVWVVDDYVRFSVYGRKKREGMA